MASDNPHSRHWLQALIAVLLLCAPHKPQVASGSAVDRAQLATTALTGASPRERAVPTAAIRFSELAEITTANVAGLLPLVARSVRVASEDPALASTAIDVPLQRFVEERTGALGMRAQGRPGERPATLSRVVSYAEVPGSELRAWDPIERQVLWSVREALPLASGTLLTAGGLVFYGTGDGWFKALDARTGRTLWKHRVEGKRLAEPSSYRGVDGHQYIAVRALPRTAREGSETVLLFALAH